MPIIVSEEQRRQAAAEDLAMKLKLESGFIRDIRSLFSDFRQDFTSRYVASGSAPDLREEFREEMKALLKRQYRRVNRKFSKRIRSDKTGIIEETKQEAQDQINDQLSRQIEDRSEEQSQIIVNTTQEEAEAALAVAIAAVAQRRQEQVDPEEVASETRAELGRKQAERSNTIAATEVNAQAETAKSTELEALIATGATVGGVNMGQESDNLIKRWDAVLDEVTRVNHANADGQRRNRDNPFDVGGQKLRFPGDTSLGATPDNVINCRCSVQYVMGPETRE